VKTHNFPSVNDICRLRGSQGARNAHFSPLTPRRALICMRLSAHCAALKQQCIFKARSEGKTPMSPWRPESGFIYAQLREECFAKVQPEMYSSGSSGMCQQGVNPSPEPLFIRLLPSTCLPAAAQGDSCRPTSVSGICIYIQLKVIYRPSCTRIYGLRCKMANAKRTERHLLPLYHPRKCRGYEDNCRKRPL
jgi:hypothetical protein